MLVVAVSPSVYVCNKYPTKDLDMRCATQNLSNHGVKSDGVSAPKLFNIHQSDIIGCCPYLVNFE